jgi:hypothetical protein
MPPASTPEYFWSRVRMVSGDACWEFQGSCDPYGHLSYQGKRIRGHVLAWKLTNGPVPSGLCVLHKCDNPPCCRPDHLFLGTRADNTKDMRAKRRNFVGEGCPWAKLTARQVASIREAYKQALFTMSELARAFEVDKKTISRIINEKVWRTGHGPEATVEVAPVS